MRHDSTHDTQDGDSGTAMTARKSQDSQIEAQAPLASESELQENTVLSLAEGCSSVYNVATSSSSPARDVASLWSRVGKFKMAASQAATEEACTACDSDSATEKSMMPLLSTEDQYSVPSEHSIRSLTNTNNGKNRLKYQLQKLSEVDTGRTEFKTITSDAESQDTYGFRQQTSSQVENTECSGQGHLSIAMENIMKIPEVTLVSERATTSLSPTPSHGSGSKNACPRRASFTQIQYPAYNTSQCSFDSSVSSATNDPANCPDRLSNASEPATVHVTHIGHDHDRRPAMMSLQSINSQPMSSFEDFDDDECLRSRARSMDREHTSWLEEAVAPDSSSCTYVQGTPSSSLSDPDIASFVPKKKNSSRNSDKKPANANIFMSRLF